MSFETKISELAKRSAAAEKKALTEEATKTSVILPFIQALGFDPFNLDEVIPEFIADVGVKKGEKVDFALKIDGKTTILIEVKPISSSLGSTQFSQLYRYFAVTDAKVAILTNGKEAWFFSDIDDTNRMDKKPFFTFNFQSFNEDEVTELMRFQKDIFSIEEILEAASTLKYTSKAANFIRAQLEDPDDEFVKVVGRQIHDGMLTKSVIEQLRPAIQSSIDLIIRDRIQDKLNIAFTSDTPAAETNRPKGEPETPPDIVTTEEELQALMIVRAVVAGSIPIERVTMRDAKSYCSVFIDDNNRKPLCRFYFNSKSKNVIGLFDAEKTEEKIEIENLEKIYEFGERLNQTAASY
jgi:hypothetical protein